MIEHAKSILLTFCIAVAAPACDNSQTAGPSTSAPSPPASSARASAAAVTSAAPAGAAPAGAAPASAVAAVTWVGTYKSEPGTLYVPTEVANGKDWKDVKWRGDLSNTGLGDGPITLAIDPSGRVSGTLAGPLGPAMINGQLEGDRLTATVTRQAPSDGGFVGTLVGSVADAKVTGTMKLSQREASVIRSATFSAAKK